MALCNQLEAQQQKRSKLVKYTRISALEALANAQGGDELQAAWKRVEENLSMLFENPEDVEDLKKCVLQNAVMGKLVPQNPDDEPASELLKNIAKEKSALIKKGEIKKQTPLPKIREDEKPFEILEGWVWCRLGTATKFITDGKHGDCKNDLNSGYYFLSAKNIKNGMLDYTNSRQITFDDFIEVHNRTNLEPGDICIINTGATVGRIAIAESNPLTPKTTFQKSVAIVKLFQLLTTVEYMKIFFKHSATHFKEKSGGSAINNLLLGDMRNFLMPLPPKEEQKRIVKKTQSLLSLCDTLQKQLAKSRKVAAHLAQSVIEGITGISTEKQVKMKAPKTELVTRLKLVKKPGMKDLAPLSAILAKNNDELSAKALWNNSGLPIDGFYRQLKIEMVNGWIDEPVKAKIRIVEDQGKPQ